MNKISNVRVAPLGESEFLKPCKLFYTQNGVQKSWDLLTIHDGVYILIYNITRNVLVFVKQFRPAVYFSDIPEEDRKETIDTEKYPPDKGCTLELCAGIVDKNLPLEEIAKQEILEECGYDVKASSLQKLISCRSVGISGDRQTIYYVEVTDDMKVSAGGGKAEEGELIEVVELKPDDVKSYLDSKSVLSTGEFVYAMTWFLQNKYEK